MLSTANLKCPAENPEMGTPSSSEAQSERRTQNVQRRQEHVQHNYFKKVSTSRSAVCPRHRWPRQHMRGSSQRNARRTRTELGEHEPDGANGAAVQRRGIRHEPSPERRPAYKRWSGQN